MTLQLLRRACGAAALMAAAVLGCSPGGGDNTGVGGVLVVSRVDVEGGNRIVLIGGSRQLQAIPRTSTGIAVPGKAVVWSSANNGQAQVSTTGVVTGISAGMVSISAIVDGITGRIDIDVRPVPVAAVEVTAGVATLEAGESTQLQAVTRDSIGGVLAGRQVAWSSSNNAAAIVSPTGLVTAMGAGSATISATSEGRSGSAILLVTARSASRLGFVVQPSNGTAGLALSPPIQVAFQDDGGATATTATGTVTLSFSANPTGATLGGTLTAQAVGGIATFADVRVNRSGQPYSLQAIAQGFAPATSTTFSVAAGAPAALAIMTAPAGSGASGDPLGQQPVIQLHDAQGNEARQAGVTVTAVIASGSGTLGGTSAIVTNAEGRAVFTDLAIIGPVGTYTLRFEAAGLTPVTSGPIGLGAGNATQITFSAAPPATTINGQPLGTTVRVQLRDGVGNPVAQSGTSVTAGLQSGTGALGGTLVVVTGADGSAAFTNLTITGIVGEFVLRFSAPGLTPAVSNPILLNAGPETAIGFVTAPGATAVNGVVLPTAPVLQLRDISGNAVAKAGVTVQAFSQSAVLGSLQGTTTLATNADGRVTFGDLVILGRVGQYTLAFRSGILSEALSNLIMLTAGPAAGIGFTTFPPLGTASGETLSPQPIIQIVDQSSNPVALGGVTITASLASGSGVLGGTLSVTTDAGGAAAFTDLAITGPSGPHTIRFRTGGYPDLISPTITVGSGSPTQVTFTVAPPATAANGTMIAPAVVVQLRDGVGNPTLLSGVAVTASRSAGSATLSGTISVATDANGSAIFDDLVLTGIAGDHQLTFSAAGLTPAVSNTIVLEPGAGTQLTFTTPPPASATNGVDLSPAVVVQLRDLSGNAVSSGGVNVTASIVTGAGGTLGGTTTVATGSNGSATFGTLRITGTVGAYTLRFSATGVTAATSNPLTLEPGLATALAIQTQPPPSTSSGAVLSPQPVVRVVDESGNTVTSSSLAVTASLASGPGTLDGPKTLAAVNGVVSYADLVITGPTGTYQIGFGATGVSGATSGTISVGAGAAAGLELVGTPPTSGTNDEALTPAVSVRLVDGAANPVAQSGVSVSAVLASGPGSLGGTVTVNTDGNGIATFDNLIITGTVGSYTIRFEVSGITPVTTGPIALSAGAATQLGFSTTPAASSTNGAPLVTQPVVQLQDASGNPVSQSGVTITAAITVNPGGSLSNASAVTAGNGQATFSGLTITGLVGLYTLTYGSGALTPVSATVSLSAGPAVAVKIVTQPSASPTNTVAFAQQPVIRLVDQSGNFTGSNGTAVTAVLGQTPGPAALGGTTTVLTGPPGVRATFTDLAISGTTGTYTLVFSSPGLASEESIAITLNPGSATQLLFTTTPPSSAVNGTVLAPAIGVRLGDATGNAVPTAGISIAAAIASGSGAVLGGTTPRLTDGTGGVSFNDLTLTGTVGDFTLTFTSSGLTPATTGIITLTSGPASKLAFTTAPPPAGVNGELLSPATVVQLRDQSDNVVNTTGTPITAAISAGAGGTLSGTLVVNTTSGSSSFGDLVITGPVGNYTLRFTSPGLTSVSAPAPLALSAGPATQLGLVVAPATSATSGAALSPQPQVQVQDQSGNPVGTGGLTVTAAVNAGASLSNATATTDAGGLAVFSGLTITGPTGNYTLSFSATSLTSVASDPITLTAGAASQLAFITAPPVSAINGAILNPQPVIELRDASNNPVLTAGVDVTASLISGPGSLLGTLTVQTTADGRATFSNLELRGLTGNYVIRFTAGGLTLDSDPITLAVGAASQLLFDQAPPPTATNGTTFSTSTIVRLADAGGNLVATDGVSVLAAVASGPGATLGGTTTRQTVSGQAIFNDLSLTGTAGIYTLDFTSGSLTKATSNSITLEPGPATKLVFITTTPATAQSGVVFDPSPVVQLQDASSNNVPQAGVSVTVARFSGDSTAIVSGGSAVTDAMGRASFSSLAITGPADDYVLAFASSPLAGLLSPTITLTAGGAVKLGFVTTPSVTATNGQPLAQQPVVQLLDAANNPVAEAGRSITISMPEAGSLTADALTALTDGSGRATFSGVTITGLVGDRTLAFSGSGLTTLTSGAIALVAGPAAALAMVTQPPGSAVEDEPLSTDPVVRLVDVSGNNVDSTGVDITATVNPLSATITGTVTVSTGAGGAATFPGLSLGGAEGTYRLAFSGPSLTGVESGDVTLLVPATVEITVAPAENAASGVPLSPQPSVVVRDGAAAPLVGVSVTATLLFESGAPATLGGSVTLVTGAGGAATWTDLTITGGPGTYRLQFTTANGTLVTAAASTVIP